MANHQESPKRIKLDSGATGIHAPAPTGINTTGTLSTGQQASKMHVFARDGDLILTVGAEKKSMRVYSLLLKNAIPHIRQKLVLHSPVHSIDHPLTTLDLPDDDPGAFLSLCALLHNGKLTTSKATPKGLLQLAKLSHKYDCQARVYYAIYSLCASQPSVLQEAWALMIAVYYVNIEYYFRLYSGRLVQDYKGSFRSFGDEGVDPAFGFRLCLALEEKRSSITKRGMDPIEDGLCLASFNLVHGLAPQKPRLDNSSAPLPIAGPSSTSNATSAPTAVQLFPSLAAGQATLSTQPWGAPRSRPMFGQSAFGNTGRLN